jgi:hypothetical protein
LLIGFVGVLSMIFHSCKKSDQQSSTNDSVLTKEQAIAKIKSQLKDKPLVTTYNLNLPGKGYYSDENGNQLDLKTIRQFRSTYDCPDPADDYFSTELISISSQYTFGHGF